MRKLICMLLALTVLLAAGIPGAFAHHGGHGGHHAYRRQTAAQQTLCQFLDDNGDGVCDNHGTDTCRHPGRCSQETCEFTDEDQDGFCDSCKGFSPEPGSGDRNGDGRCDACGRTCGTDCGSCDGTGSRKNHCITSGSSCRRSCRATSHHH